MLFFYIFCKIFFFLQLFLISLLSIFQANYKEMMSRYKQLLTYIKSAVTRNHSEKSINSILDYISTSKNVMLFFVNCNIIFVGWKKIAEW